MGIYNSSITRVQPVFNELCQRANENWLPQLLGMASRANLCRPQGFASVGKLKRPFTHEFELGATAPVDYLKTLLASPGRLRSAVECNPGILKSSKDPNVEQKRRSLCHGDSPTISQGLAKLDAGEVRSGSGTWWVLESTTKVDYALFTEQTNIFIEGKRTEPELTKSVRWDVGRNQVFRNLDALRKSRLEDKDYFMLLIVDAGSKAEAEAVTLDAGYQVAVSSWPHLSLKETRDLYDKHYLGYITWTDISQGFGITLI